MGLRQATRLLIRHVRNHRRLKYGEALLCMLVKKPIVALYSILRTAEGEKVSPTFLTDLSIPRDETSGHHLTAPVEIILRLAQIETLALSPEPTLPPGAPCPWLGHVRPAPNSSVPMIFGEIIPATMQDALHRTLIHKPAGLQGGPGPILKRMLLAFHVTYRLLFRAMAITGITPPS
jgi:hypothetical protein